MASPLFTKSPEGVKPRDRSQDPGRVRADRASKSPPTGGSIQRAATNMANAASVRSQKADAKKKPAGAQAATPAAGAAAGGKKGANFSAAFAAARKAGKGTFEYGGKSYSTKMKGEGKAKSGGKSGYKSPNMSADSKKREGGPDSDAGRLNKAAALRSRRMKPLNP